MQAAPATASPLTPPLRVAVALSSLQRELALALARQDVNRFAELVGRDEETGEPIRQAPIHRAFQRLADTHDRLVIWSHVEAGKTSQLSILRPLYAVGRNPRLRVAVVSRSKDLADKIVKTIKTYVENSDELRAVFPHLTPGRKWTDSALTFGGARVGVKDYSLQAFGIGSAIQGGRVDLLILDDILDWRNCRTPAQREEVKSWYWKQIAPRLTRKARVIVVGNAWHPQDLLHELAERFPAGSAHRFPVIDPTTGLPRWPERWPLEYIREWEREKGAGLAAQMLYCVSRSDEDSRFKQDWVDRCLDLGSGRSMPHSLARVPPGYRTYTGVDLSPGEANDTTVLFTIVVHPNGAREVLAVDQGRWAGPEIVRRILDHHRRYMSIVRVETNAAQKFILQFARDANVDLPVKAFTTGDNKSNPDFGIESLAVEMERGQWIIPSRGRKPLTKEVDAWLRDLLHYSPSAHTPDTLIAQWIAREGAITRPPARVRVGRQNIQRR